MSKTGQGFTIKRIIPLVILFILLLLPVITQDPYYLHVLIMILLGSIFAVSLRLCFLVNIFNVGHAGFAAIGAYCSVLLVMRLGLSFWVTSLLAAMLAATCAVILGYITLRVGGIYFVLISLAFNEIIRLITVSWVSLTGGYNGIANIPSPHITVLGVPIVEFTSKVPYYYLVLVLLLASLLIFHRIDRSRFGVCLKSIAESESLSESVGINVLRCKVAAFAIAAFFAGTGGSLFAHYFAYLSPSSLTVMQSFDYFFYVFVGGIASVFGPIYGVILLTVVIEALRGMVEFKMVSFAVILLLTVRFLPLGIERLPSIIATQFRGLIQRGD